MIPAGWYPDPMGEENKFRYWDGSAWSEDLSTLSEIRGGSKPSVSGWLNLAIVAAILVAVALVAWLIFGGTAFQPDHPPAIEDTNSAAPTVSGWDETTKPTPPPSQEVLVTCPYTLNSDESSQRNDGKLRGGGLMVDKIAGWSDIDFWLTWASDVHAQKDTVATGSYTEWMSNIAVGQLNAEDGFTNAQYAARQTMECLASSGYFTDFTKRVDLRSEPYKVGDYRGWRMTSEVHVSSTDLPQIEGDIVDVIVVDLGVSNKLGLYISCVTIGDTTRAKLVEDALATLKVDR